MNRACRLCQRGWSALAPVHSGFSARGVHVAVGSVVGSLLCQLLLLLRGELSSDGAELWLVICDHEAS
jgi:hypothetical protein